MMMHMLLNIIGFNLSWFGLIFLEERFTPVVLLWLGGHLYLCQQRAAECKLILSVALIGISVDSTLLFFGVFQFENQAVIPLWLMMLWVAFAATIAHSLNFLAQSKILQFFIGFIFPPLSYLAGASLTTMTFGFEPSNIYLFLGAIWSVLMLLFFYLRKKFYCQDKNYA